MTAPVSTLAHSSPDLTAARVPPPVDTDLARVEARLGAELGSREERLHQVAAHLVVSGGKRIRPTVVLLAFHAASVGHGPSRSDDAVEAAVALELIHSATLLHDDIIDGGEMRRGKPSALQTFGLADTLVGGDFLFSRAFALCARFEAEVIRWAADACVALTEGEIMQGRFRHNAAVTVADYMEIIERKTASLFAAGARTAAHLAGTPPTLVDALAECGRDLGLAFQLSDDLLDVAGRPAVTGKPRGIDLRDGNPSLPIVLAMARDPEVARVFADPNPDAAQVERTLIRIRRSGVLGVIAERARAHVDAALATMESLAPSPYRAALEALALGLVDRPA